MALSKDLVLPEAPFAVKDHQVAFFGATGVHVTGGLLQALPDRVLQTIPQELALDDKALLAIVKGPCHEEVHASPACAVLALDAVAQAAALADEFPAVAAQLAQVGWQEESAWEALRDAGTVSGGETPALALAHS